ncbi:MAG: 30S ribosomal protein S6, partial [Pseudomonadota bacterium]
RFITLKVDELTEEPSIQMRKPDRDERGRGGPRGGRGGPRGGGGDRGGSTFRPR